MGVDHRSADVIVSEQFLNRSDVVAIFQQMGGKGFLSPWAVVGVTRIQRDELLLIPQNSASTTT